MVSFTVNSAEIGTISTETMSSVSDARAAQDVEPIYQGVGNHKKFHSSPFVSHLLHGIVIIFFSLGHRLGVIEEESNQYPHDSAQNPRGE